MNDLPLDFWANENRYLAAILRPAIQRAAIDAIAQASKKLMAFNIGFDSALAHADAIDWANAHTDDMVAKIKATTERVTGKILTNYYSTPGVTIGDVVGELQQVLDGDDKRAWTIAITEITRASAEGNAISYKRAGIPQLLFNAPAHQRCRCTTAIKRVRGELVVVWYTNKDELVCKSPIDTHTSMGIVAGCNALHGRIISEGSHFGKKWNEV